MDNDNKPLSEGDYDPEGMAEDAFDESNLPTFEEFFGVDPDVADQSELLAAIDSKLMKLDQDRMNDSRKEWQFMYGFDHECSCASDAESGNTGTVPVCYLGAAREAFENLRRVRGFLYAISTSPSEDPDILKALAAEAFSGR